MTPAPVVCQNCGASNRKEARFCYRCRAPLVAFEAAPPPPASATFAETPLPPKSTETPASGEDTLITAVVRETTRIAPVATMAGGTRPLTPPTGFPPRSEGSFFGGRYEYAEAQSDGEALHVYRVFDSRPSVSCAKPVCELRGVPRPAGEGRTCQACGSPMAELHNPAYWLRESLAPDVLGREPEVAQRGLAHVALLAPRHYFVERLGPEVRHCVVVPELPATSAADLPWPQPLEQVIQWGVDLARGLAQLHAQRIAFARMNDRRIVFTAHGAALADFVACRLWPLDTPLEAMQADVQNDLRALAAELLFMLTGSREFSEEAIRQVSPADVVANFFGRALPPGVGFDTAHDLVAALADVRAAIASPAPSAGISADLNVGRATHVGMKRSLNEDSLMVMESVRLYESLAKPAGLFVVADGMGGQMSGEVASRIAIEAVASCAAPIFAPDRSGEAWSKWIVSAAEAAHRAVTARREAAGSDMGCTLVMAVVDGEMAAVGGIGDSRAYLVEASGEITQLTTDDSLVERMVAANQITREEARQHPRRSVILRAVGNGPFHPPDVITRELFLGDRLLLCSDGLSSMLDDTMIAQIVVGSASPQEACNRLVEAANASGGEDNVSVIVVEVVGVG